MTEIIDFNKWKEDKKEKEKAKYVWHSFPYFLDDKFLPGDILVKRTVYNDKTKQVETEYFFPERWSIENLYNTEPYSSEEDLVWMDKETLHKILSQYDDNDIIG